MQVFKAFFGILNRHKVSVLIYMVIFFAITMIMSIDGKENDAGKFSQVSLKIGVDNQDKGGLGEALVQYLSGKNEIEKIPKEREKLLDAMCYQKIQYVLVIPENFTEGFMAGKRQEVLEGTKVPGSSNAHLAEMEINSFLKVLGMYVEGGYTADMAAKQTLSDMQKESRVQFLNSSEIREKSTVQYYFQYIPYVFMCIMVSSLAVVLIAFNEKNVEARNKCSAMSFAGRNMQMILGSVCLMLLEYGIFMVAACILYPDDMLSIRGFLSAGNALMYMLVCLSIAFFTGRLVKKQAQINMVENVLGLGFSFLGGAFVPLELLGEGVKKVGQFTPAYWYTTAQEAIWKMESLKEAEEIYVNFGVMLLFAMAIFAVAVIVNRLKARSI